jgi:hypothetical protein
MAHTMIARDKPTSPWVRNFSALGWKVRNPENSGWIIMHPANTRVRSSDNTRWLEVK